MYTFRVWALGYLGLRNLGLQGLSFRVYGLEFRAYGVSGLDLARHPPSRVKDLVNRAPDSGIFPEICLKRRRKKGL